MNRLFFTSEAEDQAEGGWMCPTSARLAEAAKAWINGANPEGCISSHHDVLGAVPAHFAPVLLVVRESATNGGWEAHAQHADQLQALLSLGQSFATEHG